MKRYNVPCLAFVNKLDRWICEPGFQLNNDTLWSDGSLLMLVVFNSFFQPHFYRCYHLKLKYTKDLCMLTNAPALPPHVAAALSSYPAVPEGCLIFPSMLKTSCSWGSSHWPYDALSRAFDHWATIFTAKLCTGSNFISPLQCFFHFAILP